MALIEEFERQGNWLFRHRSFLPIIVLVVGYAVFLLEQQGGPAPVINGVSYAGQYQLLCLLIGLAGLLVRVYTVGYTPANTSGRNTTQGQVADQLNTRGIYSMVRHPLYLGNFLMWIAPALLTLNPWFIVSVGLFFWVYYERIMFAEEQFLRAKFQDVYLQWASQVPAFLPGLRRFERSHLPFSWKKVVRKEKTGLVALLLVFTLFDISGQAIRGQSDYNYALIGITVAACLGFVVLRWLNKYTTALRG